MKNVIITGATGFVGRWLTDYLLKKNVYVLAIVRDKRRIPKNVDKNPQFSYIETSLESVEEVNIEKRQWDVFFHLAWNGVANEFKNELDTQLNNVRLDVKMLELSYSLGCPKFVATGTVAEYVYSKGVMNYKEKQSPNDYYGAAKVSAHYFLNVRSLQLNIKYIWAILPSTYGEGREGSNILTYTISSLLKREKPIFGSLDQMWDFLYVYEVARALFFIGEKGINGKIYGIGSGVYKPLYEYVKEIRDIIDPDLSLGIGELDYKYPQLMSSCVDITELRNDTGFIPTINFTEGIKRTIKYMSERNK